MGYSEQTDWFPQLSLYGIPSTKEQIWNGITAGSPWQGVSLQQAEMEAAPRIMEAASQMPAVALEAVAQQPLPETFEEYMTNPERVAAAEKNTYNGPIFSTIGAFGHQTPEQMSIGHDAIYEYTPMGYVEQALSPSRWLYSGKTLFTDEPFQAPWNKDNPGLFTSISPEWGSLLDLGVDLSTMFIPYGIKGIRSLKGSPFGSKVRPIINTAKETTARNVPEASIESATSPRIVVKDSPIIQIGNETGTIFDSNGRLVDAPTLRLETQPIRIGTQPLSTESQVSSFNPYPRYIKKSKGYAPNNMEALEAELEGLLDPTTHVVYVRDILGKYPQFDELLYRIPTNDQRAIARIPITLNKYKNDALEALYGTRVTNPKDVTSFSGFKLSKLGLQPWKDSTGIGYPLDRIGVVSINLDNFKGLMPNPNMPLDLGQVLAHEFSHVITLNNPMHLQLLKFSPETNAKAKGISYEDFINSDFITQQGFKEYLANPQEYKGGINEAISQCGNRIWNYFFSKGETEQLARLSQLKSFVGDQSPYYLKTYTTNWNKSKFKTVDDLKRAFQLYLTQNPDNTMSTYYNILELGGNTAWENALQQINHWAPVLVPGAVGAGVVLGNSDDESSSDIDDDI